MASGYSIYSTAKAGSCVYSVSVVPSKSQPHHSPLTKLYPRKEHKLIAMAVGISFRLMFKPINLTIQIDLCVLLK